MNTSSTPPINSHPWDLARMPNYAQAQALPLEVAESLTPQRFQREYVARNRPCLIKGAVTHWPAFSRWASIEHLKGSTRNEVIAARSAPIWEFPDPGNPLQEEIDRRNQGLFEELPFHEFLDRAFHRPGQLVVHSAPLHADSPFGGLLRDLGGYAFAPQIGCGRAYVPMRAFFYRESYTDWHFHPADETLMTQVVGAKEVLLLPPNEPSWDALQPVAESRGYLYDIDLEQFPAVAGLVPYRALVEAGDALYIPVYWWHAVASADAEFGVTVASTFPSPLHVAGDMRFPFARRLFRGLLRSRHAPLALGAVAYAYLYRLMALRPGLPA